MDKSEKLALARKKLRKYQAKGSPPTNHITEHINSHHSAPHPPTKQLKTNAEMSDNVHSQTIDILVAEKSSLKNQLSIHEMQLQTKQIELTNLQDEVKNLRSQLEKSQRDKDKLTTSLSEKSKLLSDQSTSDISLRLTLQQCNGQIEELNQQKSELTSKVNQLALQLQQVEQARLELSEKLKIYEVNNLSHQAQVADDVSANDKRKIEELEGQVATLSAAVQSAKREREQSLRDVDALRDALMENKQESARKIGDLQTQLKESQLHLSSLNQRLSFHQQQGQSIFTVSHNTSQ
jgi:chromosome segregation ATPase